MQHPEYLYHYTSVLNLPYIMESRYLNVSPQMTVQRLNLSFHTKKNTNGGWIGKTGIEWIRKAFRALYLMVKNMVLGGYPKR